MERVISPESITVSFEKYGSGPPLVLVHGAFSDHQTNWEFVRPILGKSFTVHAIARRGRGKTDATEGHGIEDEARDVAAVIRSVGEPVFLLGHSYGAHTSLAAAAIVPELVLKLVIYEPAYPRFLPKEKLAKLNDLAAAGDWEGMSLTFFRDLLQVPQSEIDEVKAAGLWAPILADAPATLHDLRAISSYDFQPGRFASLRMPVLLQVGTESPRELYATDALDAVLANSRVEELPGQAHEGMTTAPDLYAASVTRFLLE